MIKASEARKGRLYRRTRNTNPGSYYTVPKAAKLKDIVARWQRKEHTSLNARDGYWLGRWRSDPSGVVLLVWHQRVTDPLTQARSEVKRYVLADKATRLREVQRPPGYSSRRQT